MQAGGGAASRALTALRASSSPAGSGKTDLPEDSAAADQRLLISSAVVWPLLCWWLPRAGAAQFGCVPCNNARDLSKHTCCPTEICAEALDTWPHCWDSSNAIHCTDFQWSESFVGRPGSQPWGGADRACPGAPEECTDPTAIFHKDQVTHKNISKPPP